MENILVKRCGLRCKAQFPAHNQKSYASGELILSQANGLKEYSYGVSI